MGRSEGGNANWVKVGPIMAQPSEFLKLALIVFLGFMVSKSASKRGDWKAMSLAVGLPILTALGAVMLGRDMGTAMVVAVGALGAMWVAGLPKRWFGGLVMLAVPTMVLLVLSNPTRIRRILAILPGTSKGPDESAPEQIDHSLWALGSGGLTGLGPGASREKWNYLQAAHTDFIFAIVGEEFGLLGALGVLVCLGLLIWGMFRVARESSDLFVTIVSSGVASWIGIQTVINVLSVTRLGPVIGVPLDVRTRPRLGVIPASPLAVARRAKTLRHLVASVARYTGVTHTRKGDAYGQGCDGWRRHCRSRESSAGDGGAAARQWS